jgi:hypothetical protein
MFAVCFAVLQEERAIAERLITVRACKTFRMELLVERVKTVLFIDKSR